MSGFLRLTPSAGQPPQGNSGAERLSGHTVGERAAKLGAGCSVRTGFASGIYCRRRGK